MSIAQLLRALNPVEKNDAEKHQENSFFAQALAVPYDLPCSQFLVIVSSRFKIVVAITYHAASSFAFMLSGIFIAG